MNGLEPHDDPGHVRLENMNGVRKQSILQRTGTVDIHDKVVTTAVRSQDRSMDADADPGKSSGILSTLTNWLSFAEDTPPKSSRSDNAPGSSPQVACTLTWLQRIGFFGLWGGVSVNTLPRHSLPGTHLSSAA